MTGTDAHVDGKTPRDSFDTTPKLLLRNADVRATKPAMREKDFGIWQEWTWADVADEVRRLAHGFAALGLNRGDRISIVGDNRPRLYWSMVAAQALGAVPVPVYQDSVAEELKFVLDHAEVRFVIAEDQEQVDKMIEVIADVPTLERVVYDDPRGLRHYEHDYLIAYDTVIEMGEGHAKAHPGFFEEEISKGEAQDTAVMLYTSGTTGRPKGVILSYRNILSMAQGAIDFEGLAEDEEVLAYLPMAWAGDFAFSGAQSYLAGFCVSCPESPDTMLEDLRELGPTYFFAPPRIFENILTTVTIRMEDAGWLKRRMYHYFLRVARRAGEAILDGRRVSLVDRLLYAIGQVLVYGPLRNTLGLNRIRLAYTAGEAIGPDIFRFYRSLGINLKQIYGQTEASVFVTLQPNGEVDPDTVGVPAPGVEINIAENGEVLFRSEGAFEAYYKNDKATAETKTPDGWVHTGDAGFFDDKGHLRIIDRAKDVGQLNNGSLFAPKFIENKLKFFPEIREAVAFGHERDMCCAFINIDLEAVGNWAERRGIPYASYQDLAARREVYDLIADHVAQVNRDLAAESHLAASQIHRFLILHKELDPDDGELTRTRKVRRGFISDKYAPLVEGLYSGASHAEIETQVTFEDGRKGKMRADLEIRDAEVYQADPHVEDAKAA